MRERLELALGPGLRERRFDERIDAVADLVVEHARDEVTLGRHRVAAEMLPVEAELVESNGTTVPVAPVPSETVKTSPVDGTKNAVLREARESGI